MKIITNTCPSCGTIVAGNVLERHRVMKCPGLGCDAVRRFEDLSPSDQEHIVNNLDRYRMD